MNTCAVTIAGPDRRVDLVVSTETPISDLIPTFVELSMDEAPVRERPRPGVDRDAARPAAAAAGPHARPVRRGRRRRAHADRDPLGGDGAAQAGRGGAQAARFRAGRRASARRRRCPRSSRAGSAFSLAFKAFFGYEPEPPITESPEPRGPEQPRGADQARAAVGAGALEGELARERLRGAPGPRDRRAAAHPLRHDRRRLAEGRRGEDHHDRAARLAAGARAPRPHRRRRHQPGLRVLGADADPRPPGVRRRPRRRARAARPVRDRPGPPSRARLRRA